MSQDIHVITIGCRLNHYESEVMREHAKEQKLGNTVIINTCAVTHEAERQSRQAVRRAKKENPSAQIIVAGCSAQLNPQVYAQMPEVDRVLGNHEKMQAQSFQLDPIERVRVNDIFDVKETAHHLLGGFEDQVRAFIQIQNGCDHRCTFCSIPLSRGNNRSVPMGEIVHQINHLVERGCLEVVLTGVDITGYGSDLPGTPSLGVLCQRILLNCPNLSRLRLSSLDPAEMDETLYEVIAQEKRLMPHFHISLQSGDDMILKRMKRRHLRKDVFAFCERIRSLRPDAVFGIDIIAGFPTETDEMFENSCELIKTCDFTYLHVFPYSARKDTPAARMPQVPSTVIKKRAAHLRQMDQESRQAYYSSFLNTTVEVLMESGGRGHTHHYVPVSFEASMTRDLKGQIVKAKVLKVTDSGVVCSLLEH